MDKRKTLKFLIFLFLFSLLSYKTAFAATGDRSTPYSARTSHRFTLQEYSWDSSKAVELKLDAIYTGDDANYLVENENIFNDVPGSDQEWILMGFTLKYVSGPEEAMHASDVLWSYGSFYTNTGTKITPVSIAAFSKILEGYGEYDVELYPGGSSPVWYGILVNKTVGYPLIRIPTGYVNDSTTYTWFSTDPNYTESTSVTGVTNFVMRFYQLCLGRMPDESGLKYWVNGLVNKTFTGAGAANNFIFSKEFLSRNVTDSQYIDIMYKAFFDRAADSSGKAYWVAKLANGNSRLFVLSSFVNSAEFNTVCRTYGINRGSITLTKSQDLHPKITEFVYRLYVKCLGRKPDDSGLNYYVSQLASGKMSGTSAAYHFVFSTELTSRNLSNKDFVTILYRVLLNREPDAGGLAYYVGKLSTSTSRASVFNNFASSAEFANICGSYGIKVK